MKNKNNFVVYGRPVQIFQRIVDEYAENLLASYDIREYIDHISDTTLKRIIKRELCRETYFRKVPINLYGNTRTVWINRHVAEEYAIYKSLNPYVLEGYLRMCKRKNEIPTMSDEELSEVLEDILRDDLLTAADIAQLYDKDKSKFFE